MELDIPNLTFLPSSVVSKAVQTNTASPTKSDSDPTAYSISLTPDYLSFRNTWFGQPQPISYKLIWRAYIEDPIVRACVDITVDAIIGDGYSLESEDESHLKEMKDVFKENHFQSYLQDTVASIILYADAYSELIRDDGGLVRYFKPVDTASVRVDYDEHGFVLKYIQRVLHRRVDFYPDEMVHYSFNNIGGRVYGNSFMQSIIFTLQAKIAAGNYNTEWFRRPGLPRSLYLVKNLSTENVNRMAATLRTTTPQSDLILNAQGGEINHVSVSPSNQDMQFVELMEFLRTEIIAATGVPPVFLGITEGSNRSSAQTQMEAWDRRKKKLRIMIEDVINTQLLKKSNFGYDDVHFKFNDENSRELLKYGQVAQLMSTIPYTTPDQILDVLDLPPMEDKKLVYNSSTGEIIRNRGKGVGGTPIYKIQEAQQQAQMKVEAAVDPHRNQTKEDNAQRLNSEQANETRSERQSTKDITPSTTPPDYPFGAVEPEKIVTNKVDWKLMEDRIAHIVQILSQTLANKNPETDDTSPNAGKKKVPKKKKETADKAVFFDGMTQLEENL